MADEHRVARIESLEDGAHVLGEVLEGMAGRARQRAAVPVVRYATARKPASGSASSWWNQERIELVTPCESTIGGPSPVSTR